MKKLFLIGALGYPALEVVYRGRTHYSMGIAGGTAAVLVDRIRKQPLPSPAKAMLCGLGITGIEYICGCIWNRDYRVWDYRSTPMNFRGQICLPFTLVWSLLGAGMMKALDAIDERKMPGS